MQEFYSYFPFFQIVNILLPFFYALSLLGYIYFFRTENNRVGKWASKFLLTGIVLHIFFLFLLSIRNKNFPVSNPIQALSLVSFNIALIYFVIEKVKKEKKTALFFLVIVLLLKILSSLFIFNTAKSSSLLNNPLFGIHTGVVLLGISALAVSAIYGLMYWLLAEEIKAHRFGAIYNGLPPLESLEDMGRVAMILGIILLGFGILFGHIWLSHTLGTYYKCDSKIIVTDVVWVSYFISWIVISKNKWRGLLFGKLAFLSFLLFLFILLLVNIYGESFHNFM